MSGRPRPPRRQACSRVSAHPAVSTACAGPQSVRSRFNDSLNRPTVPTLWPAVFRHRQRRQYAANTDVCCHNVRYASGTHHLPTTLVIRLHPATRAVVIKKPIRTFTCIYATLTDTTQHVAKSTIRASDGIRTRVNGFAGRCLATQPHPHRSVTIPAQPGPAQAFPQRDL